MHTLTRYAACATLGVLQEPFVLTLQLFATLLARPTRGVGAVGLTCSAHVQPHAILEALLAVLYPAAAGQAVARAASTAAAETSAIGQLLPWIRRAALLMQLLGGSPLSRAPAAASTGGAAAAALEALLQQLRLPPLCIALQSPAAAGQHVDVPAPVPATTPYAAQLLELPSSYQVRRSRFPRRIVVLPLHSSNAGWLLLLLLLALLLSQGWYLSLGTRRCSVCDELPSEPAMCLRCGAILCCGGRHCQGPSRQVRTVG